MLKISLSALLSPEPVDGLGSNFILNISGIVSRTDFGDLDPIFKVTTGLRLAKISLFALSPEPVDGFGSGFKHNINGMVLRIDLMLVTLTQFSRSSQDLDFENKLSALNFLHQWVF